MSKTIQYKEFYKSRDTEISSILYANKQTLESSYWENGACYFLFNDKEACEKIISDYFNDKIIISAKSVMEAIRTIKSIIYSK